MSRSQIHCSICISTRDKAYRLDQVLSSIYLQTHQIDFNFEVIVVDDGSSDETPEILDSYATSKGLTSIRLNNTTYRNPSVARNVAYREASGEIIIAQSDDVVHVTNAVSELCNRLQSGTFVIAQVINVTADTRTPVYGYNPYTGTLNQRPFFFLGALWREDLYAVGGNDEEFTAPGFDDDWFGDCLVQGRGLHPIFEDSIVGHHLDHSRPTNLSSLVQPSKELYFSKRKRAVSGQILWQSSGGLWDYDS